MKILVIGGGMAGLTYAIVSLKNGHQVVLAERNSRVGKKVAMTGNGKCNIGNVNVSEHCFNDSPIAKAVCKEISHNEYVKFLNSCGIFTFTDEMGRVYPMCESASNVVDCLRHQFAKYGGKLLAETEVQNVTASNGKYSWNNQTFDKVVLACGSGSQAPNPSIFGVVEQSWFTPTYPSLVPVKVADMDGGLNGIRAKATVNLLLDGQSIATQGGEVLFKDYGLSGICIFNLSAIIARNKVLDKKGKYSFEIDLAPQMTYNQLAYIVNQRASYGEMDKLFYGILHNKIAQSIAKRSKNVSEMIHNSKHFVFKLERLLDYTMSQVTAGGISASFVNLPTLTLPNGIVALGEVLDVDGVCGGNNLYFAASSALYTFTKEQRELAYQLQ